MVRPVITSCAIMGPLHTRGAAPDLGAGHGVGVTSEIQSVAMTPDERTGEYASLLCPMEADSAPMRSRCVHPVSR